MPAKKKVRASPKAKETPMEVDEDVEEGPPADQQMSTMSSRGFRAEGSTFVKR